MISFALLAGPGSFFSSLWKMEFDTVIMEVKDGPYKPIGPEDILAL